MRRFVDIKQTAPSQSHGMKNVFCCHPRDLTTTPYLKGRPFPALLARRRQFLVESVSFDPPPINRRLSVRRVPIRGATFFGQDFPPRSQSSFIIPRPQSVSPEGANKRVSKLFKRVAHLHPLPRDAFCTTKTELRLLGGLVHRHMMAKLVLFCPVRNTPTTKTKATAHATRFYSPTPRKRLQALGAEAPF